MSIAEESGEGCGAGSCLVVTPSHKGSQQELWRRRGWHTCFAEAAWTGNSEVAAAFAANCYGEPVGFTYDLLLGRRSDLGVFPAELGGVIREHFDVPPDVDAFLWAQSPSWRAAFARSVRRP